MNRIRWLILIIGPWPILGSSWVLSGWFHSEPRGIERNDAHFHGLAVMASAMAAPLPTETPDAAAELTAMCADTSSRLKTALGEECQVSVFAPFVIGGDLSREQQERWYRDTIAPAVSAMRTSYFDVAPNRPITVLLFSEEASYNRYCRQLYGESDISIYGYYKPNQRTLVLNVATGSGTLLHELTHALIDFDFTEAPVWFNEGLASLHEQCRFRSGPAGAWIEGLVNWRLKGLQQVARQGRLKSVSELIADEDFRGPEVGTNYAQARYFCLYLQQRGKLAPFYRDFRHTQRLDPTGQQAVARLFPDWTEKQLNEDFQRWMLALSDGQ